MPGINNLQVNSNIDYPELVDNQEKRLLFDEFLEFCKFYLKRNKAKIFDENKFYEESWYFYQRHKYRYDTSAFDAVLRSMEWFGSKIDIPLETQKCFDVWSELSKPVHE